MGTKDRGAETPVASEPSGAAAQVMEAAKKVLTKENMELAQQKASEFYQTAKPVILNFIPYCLVAAEHIRKAWIVVSPFLTNEIVDALYYIVLLFFGGRFAVTIACFQAFKVCGGAHISESIEAIKDQAKQNFNELKHDKVVRKIVDTNGDGEFQMEEVKEAIMKCVRAGQDGKDREEASQLIFAVMKIVDPEKFLSAFGGLWSGLLAVYATMRSQMAQSIAIGHRIGGMVAEFVRYKFATDLYEKFSEHKKWVDSVIMVACSIVSIIVATILQRMISALNSATEGARGLSKILIDESHSRGLIAKPVNIDSNEGMLVVWALTAIGFLWQLSSGFSLPWYLYIPLSPLVTLESMLSWGTMY